MAAVVEKEVGAAVAAELAGVEAVDEEVAEA